MKVLSELGPLLLRAQEQAEQLNVLLQKEYDAYKAHALPDDMLAILEEKQALLMAFQETDKALHDALSARTNGEHDLSRVIESMPAQERSQYQHVIQALQTTVQQCSRLNLSNGTIVNSRLKNVQDNLSILRRGSLDETSGYNSSGELV